MLESLLNTNKIYAYVGLVPVLQTATGVSLILSNIVGAVKDLAILIFTQKGATIHRVEKENLLNLNNLKFNNLIKEKNEIINSPLSKDCDNIVDCRYLIERLNSVKLEHDFPLLDAQQHEIDVIRTIPVNWEYISKDKGKSFIERNALILEIGYRYDNLIAQSKIQANGLFDMKTPSERLHDVAVATLTAIPIVGTVYNAYSIKHISK